MTVLDRITVPLGHFNCRTGKSPASAALLAREFDNVDTGGAVMFTGRPWRGEEPLVNDWMDGAHVVADSAQAACELLDRLG